jgi:hypothetical protein
LERNKNFEIKLPKTTAEALSINKEIVNTLWANAIAKEMKNVVPAFKIAEDNESVPRCHYFFKCHLILIQRWRTFAGRPGWLVADGYMTKAPVAIIYACGVLRETVMIALTIAALND